MPDTALIAKVQVLNSSGLHARPSAMIVKASSKFACQIWISKDDEQVNGKSIMGLIMLAAGYGSALEIEVTGSEGDEALKSVVNIIETQLFEPDCRKRLNSCIHNTLTTDPNYLAFYISSGNPANKEPNDLYYWLTRNAVSPNNVVDSLVGVVAGEHVIKKEAAIDERQEEIIAANPYLSEEEQGSIFWEWKKSAVDDVVIADRPELARHSNGGRDTVKIEREFHWVIKFGANDLNVFSEELHSKIKNLL